MIYAFPRERPLPGDAYDYAFGPLLIGNTQVQQYSTRWVAWVASETVRIVRMDELEPLSDTLGDELDLLTEGEDPPIRPSKLALCFDQDALPIIAWQFDATTINIRRKVSSVITEYTFAGVSPALFYNGVLLNETGDTDAACFYLGEDGDKVFVRFQRDNFADEYLWCELPSGITLAKIQKADSQNIGGTSYQLLWAVATDGRQIFLRSEGYPPRWQFAQDKMSLTTTAEGGSSTSPIMIGLTADLLTLDHSAAGGDYTFAIIFGTAPTDKLTLDHSADGGVYTLIVVSSNAPTEKLTLDHTADSGAYTEVVVTSNAPTEKLTLDVSAAGGSYP